MTKLITFSLIIIAAWVGWVIYKQWSGVSSEQELSQKEAERAHAAPVALNPRTLPGMPEKLKDKMEDSLDKAQLNGAEGLRKWLKTYRKLVNDPRLGWIELDYVVLVAQDDPREAKRVFNDIKERTPPTSPIYPRIKQLEKTYE